MKLTVAILSFSAFCVLQAVQKPSKPVTSLEGLKKKLKGYSYVPSGKIVLEGDTVSVQGFFMLKTEVSNFHYQEFLAYLKNQGKTEEYQAALPDTMQWTRLSPQMQKYTDYYFCHPAYRNYPLVNINYRQAEAYCHFLTEVWRKQTGNDQILFRVPTRAEYLKACYGNTLRRPYSWNHPYLRNSRGVFMCNFLALGDGVITRDTLTNQLKLQTIHPDFFSWPGDYADVTAPVESFTANEYGFYHLNGNVAEMISDGPYAVGGDWNAPGYDIRCEAKKNVTQSSPTVGFRPVMTYVAQSK